MVSRIASSPCGLAGCSLGNMFKINFSGLNVSSNDSRHHFFFHLPKQNLHAPQLRILLSPPTPAVPIQPCLLGLTTRAAA